MSQYKKWLDVLQHEVQPEYLTFVLVGE